MKRCALLCAVALFISVQSMAQNPTGDSSIIPPGARLELLFDGAYFTEGAAVAPDGKVYFSDITTANKTGLEAGHIWVYDPNSGETRIFRSPSGQSNGIKFDAQGRMLCAEGADFGGRRVTRTDMKTGKAVILAGTFGGKKFNSPNDISIDERGRVYFSDPRYQGMEPVEQPVQAVYRVDPDGSIHRIITDAGKPNGVCVSPDQKTLYVVSNDDGLMGYDQLPDGIASYKGRMALLAYDLYPDGNAKFRKVLADYYPQDGPDGLTCDAEGNLYVAVRDQNRFGIYVYSPEGKELAYIPTPELPTNCGFGRGATAKVLYITAGNKLFKIDLLKAGYHLPQR